MELSIPQLIAVMFLPLVFAITLHEAAHGWVAKCCGDKTAYLLGRVSLNPIRHIDWFGTVILPFGLVLVAKMFGGMPFIFGWAKPVPVVFDNLRNQRRDQVLVALAGPAANVLMALIWGGIAKYASVSILSGQSMGVTLTLARFAFFSGIFGIIINTVLAVLNLIPLPPLDGSRVVSALLPRRLAAEYARIEPYGLWILLLLVISGILPRLIAPLFFMMTHGLMILFKLPTMSFL